MSYRRVLLLADFDAGAGTAVDIVRRVAPGAQLLLVVARFPASGIAWFSAQAPADQNGAATGSLDALRSSARGAAESVEIRVEPDIDANDLADIVEAAGIDLLVTRSLPEIAQVRKRRPLTVLLAADETAGSRPIEDILCVTLGERDRRAVGRFLRDHARPGVRVTALVNRVFADAASLLRIGRFGGGKEVAGTGPRPSSAREPSAGGAGRHGRGGRGR
jgi:hypothetical protein